MILIKVKAGEEESTVYCDNCGRQKEWKQYFRRSELEELVREMGWSCEKYHVCADCMDRFSWMGKQKE